MGTRFKLRVCTWNVGNAAPPVDLRQWLGTDNEEYDIIVVGAQEANFGAEKIQTPSPVSSPVSNNDLSQVTETPPRAQARSSPNISSRTVVSFTNTTPMTSNNTKLSRLSKAVRGATSIFRAGSRQGKERNIARRRSGREEQDVELRECVDKLNHELLQDDTSEENSPFPQATTCKSLAPEEVCVRIDDSAFEGSSPCPSGMENDTEDGDPFAVPCKTFEEVTDSPIESPDQKSEVEEVRFSYEPHMPLLKRIASQAQAFSKRGGENETSQQTMSTLTPPNTEQQPPSPEFSLRRMLTGHRFKDSNTSNPSRTSRNAPLLDDSTEDDNQTTPSRNRKFSQVIEKNIPSSYHLIAKYHLMEIKLLIFVHGRHKSRVARTECMAEATGLGNVVGNKGGVAAKLTLDDTTFCFVCCHLAAHEGAKFLQQRNDDVVEIMRNIDRNKIHGLPAMHQYDHLFWLGDLNYRLDLKRVLPVATTWSHQERWCHVVDLISEGRYRELSQLDELVHEMAAKRVFAGFVEGEIGFPPTFKVERGKAYASYQSLRVPSYCDRILWHSLPLHRNHVKLREYTCVDGIDTSDHKPVYGSFDLVIPNAIRVFPLPAPRDSLKCTIDFRSLRLHGLYEKKNESEDKGLRYEVLADGALAVTTDETSKRDGCGENESGGSHTRRVVHADFHGGGIFIKERPHRAEVPLKGGRVRGCGYGELPKIALKPVGSLGDLTYKYVTIVFTRLGSRQGSSCVLSLASLVQGRHGVKRVLELTKYGECVAKVEVEAELVASLETWVDGQNRVVRPKR